MTIRVVLVDDHPLVTDGLRSALEQQADVDVVGSAATLEHARDLVAGGGVDVAIVDIRLADGSGLELIAESTGRPGAPAFLVLSSFDTPQYVDAAMRLGASGFLLKTAPTVEVVGAVRRIAAGGLAYGEGVSRETVTARWRPLTRRERDIVHEVLEGRSNDEIGARLGISRKTVETHLSRLFERFGVPTRTELALRAERERWLDMPTGNGRR